MKIQQKRSAALDGSVAKEPTAAQTDFGEVCVNFNAADPALFIRDNADNIVRVGGDLSLYQKIADNPPTTICATPDDIDSLSPPAERVEGALWWNSEDGTLYVWFEDADSSQWVIAIPGNGFSGDYNDLTNKPNIPPEFNLDEGSVENDIIHWAEIGSVQAISTTDTGAVSSGNAYSNIPATGGNGSGLVCNVIRRKNTGIHEVYVADRGEGYQVGDTVFLDLGYADGGSTGTTGINCTIDQVNDTVDGWVARPGNQYFISSTADSVNTGVPQFMAGLQCGGDTITRRIDDKPFPLVLQPIGDKGGVGVDIVGNRDSASTPSVQFEAGFNTVDVGELLFRQAADDNPQNTDAVRRQKLAVSITKWEFQQVNAGGTGHTNRMSLDYNGTEGVTLSIINGETGAGGTKKLELDWKTIAMGGNNAGSNSLRFGSTNGKYNFWKTNQTSGYQINAEGGSAGFILPEEAAKASNYNAEGEYTGPVYDRVAALIERVNALESNEIIDDATDTSLLQLVANASARLDSIEARLAALENA